MAYTANMYTSKAKRNKAGSDSFGTQECSN